MKAEILNVDMLTYVRDAFDGPPSLSSSIAHRLVNRSPAHAWFAHPRLNPAWEPDEDRAFDLGTAAHAVLLEGRVVCALNFPDFRTKAAREAREAALADGGLPVLEHQAEAITQMVLNARAKIATSPDLVSLGELLPERTIRWQEGEAHCRTRPDWLTYDHAVILSLKTTRASAEPDAFLRTILNSGYDMQCAFELAGVKALTGAEPKYVWLAIECEPPFAASLVAPGPTLLDLAQQRFRAAVSRWTACVAADRWPAYPDRVCYLDAPPWALTQLLERDAHTSVDDGRPLADQLAGMGDL
jgi:hypothetical protein